jgi:hypothetical protein
MRDRWRGHREPRLRAVPASRRSKSCGMRSFARSGCSRSLDRAGSSAPQSASDSPRRCVGAMGLGWEQQESGCESHPSIPSPGHGARTRTRRAPLQTRTRGRPRVPDWSPPTQGPTLQVEAGSYEVPRRPAKPCCRVSNAVGTSLWECGRPLPSSRIAHSPGSGWEDGQRSLRSGAAWTTVGSAPPQRTRCPISRARASTWLWAATATIRTRWRRPARTVATPTIQARSKPATPTAAPPVRSMPARAWTLCRSRTGTTKPLPKRARWKPGSTRPSCALSDAATRGRAAQAPASFRARRRPAARS